MSLRQRLLPLSVCATGLCGCAAISLCAQQPVTRAQATAVALARGARAAFGRADTAAAGAMLHGARLYPNPTASASYTKDVPHYHVVADLPLDLPWIRSARIGAAASAQDAARYGFAFERAAIRFDVDTMYTRALAALARARLSRRNALDADSLHKMAQLRREVGDVSELDVRLAAVNAGQLENVAADDSVAGVQALLAVPALQLERRRGPTGRGGAISGAGGAGPRATGNGGRGGTGTAQFRVGAGAPRARSAVARERRPRRGDVVASVRRGCHPP